MSARTKGPNRIYEPNFQLIRHHDCVVASGRLDVATRRNSIVFLVSRSHTLVIFSKLRISYSLLIYVLRESCVDLCSSRIHFSSRRVHLWLCILIPGDFLVTDQRFENPARGCSRRCTIFRNSSSSLRPSCSNSYYFFY